MLAFRDDLITKNGGKDKQDVMLSGPLPIPQITFFSRLLQQNIFVFYWMVYSKMSWIHLFS